ncbi:Bor/Iss family lipoprotein [Leptospira gomenensis]|uniref:Bor/Iss family lipoprotein n=1 Tax=Leptospira gomenensis TaxID=2484974 RepID=UPI00143846B6|nr:hypothetical protein [Leptospira gomenensis]
MKNIRKTNSFKLEFRFPFETQGLGLYQCLIRIFVLSAFCIFFFEECRHAWVRFPQNPPQACRIYQQSNECKRALEEQKSKQGELGKIHTIRQKYYFFGLYPKEQIVDASKFCPEGPKSAHQFTSFWDALWEQVTFTVYSPQTLELECYP